MNKITSLDELAARVRLGIMINHVPGFADAFMASMAGKKDYRTLCERKLARMVLGRDHITTDDVIYDSNGRVEEIGGQKVQGYNAGLMPERVGDRRIIYGLFGMPVGLG
jgi:hypothetical protein